jgi:hypothetical protein
MNCSALPEELWRLFVGADFVHTDREQEHVDAIRAMIEADSGRVEVQGDAIVVTLPETAFRVIYSKPDGEPGLIASGIVREPGLTLAERRPATKITAFKDCGGHHCRITPDSLCGPLKGTNDQDNLNRAREPARFRGYVSGR